MSKRLVFAAALMASASAFAATSTSIRFMSRDADDPRLSNSAIANYVTGGLNYVDAAGSSFVAYCIEPEQSFALSTNLAGNPNFKAYTPTSFSGTQGDLLQGLYSSSFSGVHNGQQQAAFQLAVWEIVRETSGTLSIAQGAGSFYLQSSGLTGQSFTTAQSVEQLANGYLALAQAYHGPALYTLTKLTNATYQDLVFATATNAVPEPQTYALLLGGLGIVGLVARRRLPR